MMLEHQVESLDNKIYHKSLTSKFQVLQIKQEETNRREHILSIALSFHELRRKFE